VTPFDYIALAILIVSGLIGLARGGAREVITVLAFLAAVVLAVLGLRLTGPLARHWLHPPFLANAVAILVGFSVVYIALRLAGSRLTRPLSGKSQALTMVDRAAGVGFGLLRGVLALGVLYLVFNAATPPERVPVWIKGAAFYPLSATAGRMLMALAPKGALVAEKVGPALDGAAADQGPAGRPPEHGKGYDAQSRQSVDELVEKTR
jgi:membrane protein required for colicin V production